MSYKGGLTAKATITRHQNNWMFKDNMAVIDGVVIKGKHVVILKALQWQVRKQLHINHMGIKKTKCLACESIY